MVFDGPPKLYLKKDVFDNRLASSLLTPMLFVLEITV